MKMPQFFLNFVSVFNKFDLIMKKLIVLVAVALAFTACNKESYRHMVALDRPSSGQYGVVYADQQADSVIFSTFDSYKVSTNETWITVDPEWASKTITNSYWGYWKVAVPLSFTPNVTGETRLGQVAVNSYGVDNWDRTVTAAYLQLGWLNITRPEAELMSYTDYPRKASFTQQVGATQEADTLQFTVYGDWTLSTEAPYIHLVSTGGTKGLQTVGYTLDANDAAESREAYVHLVSNGVTQAILIKQGGKN